jgi:N-methylhydantoinase A
MFAFGGAGPTHVGSFARDVEVKEAVIPFCSSAFSAFGVGISDVVHIAEVSKPMRSPFDGAKIHEILEELETRSRGILHNEGFPDDALSFRRYVKMKYGGQVHELTVPIEGNSKISTGEGIESLIKVFETIYESRYGIGTAYRQAGVELLSFQLHSVGKTKKPKLKERPLSSRNPPSSSLKQRREVYWTEYKGLKATSIFSREALLPGNEIAGPAVIEGIDSTIVIHPGERARVDGLSNIRLTFEKTI